MDHFDNSEMGRPSKFTQELANDICEMIVEGSSIRQIAEEKDIAVSSIMLWLNQIPNFSEQYARAKEMQAEEMADSIQAIADEEPVITTVITSEKGSTVEKTQIDNAGIQRNRLRVDARKWIAAKLLPKKYGDRIAVDASVTNSPDNTARLVELLTAAAQRAGTTSQPE